MKITVLFTVLALVAVTSCHQQLRRHELPFLDSMGPLEMARFMSGDYAAALPTFLQPIARKIMGQEQSGTSSLLQKASGLFGGSNSSGNSGMFGGMGDLFKSAGGSSGNGIFSQFSNAFGGASEKSGSSSALSGLSNLIPGGSSSGSSSGSGFSNIFSGILPSWNDMSINHISLFFYLLFPHYHSRSQYFSNKTILLKIIHNITKEPIMRLFLMVLKILLNRIDKCWKIK